MENKLTRTVENRGRHQSMDEQKRRSVLQTLSKQERSLEKLKQRQALEMLLRREHHWIQQEGTLANYQRINKVEALRRQSVMDKIDRDTLKIQMIQKEKARISELKQKAQKQGELKKQEIIKQFESIKKRGGQISQEDMLKLGLSKPSLLSTSGDLQQPQANGAPTGYTFTGNQLNQQSHSGFDSIPQEATVLGSAKRLAEENPNDGQQQPQTNNFVGKSPFKEAKSLGYPGQPREAQLMPGLK